MDKSTLPCRQPGFWPEKKTDFQPFQHPLKGWLHAVLRDTRKYRYEFFAPFADLVNGQEGSYAAMSPAELRAQADILRTRLYQDKADAVIAAEVFAMVREQASRVLGQRHFDVQLVGGWVMLNGMVAEMATGEGKTLTATLPASFAALAGIPVHIITTNDYLAQRDADHMQPLYASLGIEVGAIQACMSANERKEVYNRDIVYCSNKELVFDYLRDRLLFAKQPPGAVNLPLRRLAGESGFAASLRLRGLHYAIVDEADSIFIDEARTPLILSQAGDCGLPADIYQTILAAAKRLHEGLHFSLDRTARSLTLTPQGSATVAELPTRIPALMPYRRTLDFLLRRALIALHLFANGREYIVADKQIAIIGENTGRVMAGRSWEMSLQQFIETKEGCPLTAQPETLTKINFQKFFNRYIHLAGMTGTAREVARELENVYNLQVISVPTNAPSQRHDLGCRLFVGMEEKMQAIITRLLILQREKRPVLLGTASVHSSEMLSARLRAEGLQCTLLNARQDREEAEVITQAGRVGQITVATNMAGRGTDILLAPSVAERGGLHVIATECANSRRIDRQLFGRCGRQGDPGSFEALFCLEDQLFADASLTAAAKFLLFCRQRLRIRKRLLMKLLISTVQKNLDRRQYLLRRQLLEQDSRQEQALSFNRYGP